MSLNRVRATWLELVAFATLAISLIHRVLTTWSREYISDDFYFAYAAWLRSGPGLPHRDYYMPNFTPLAELAAPLFRMYHDTFVPLEICRGVMLVIGFALVYATYELALALGATRLWALIAVNLLTWQKHFSSRISDIRSDQIAALLLVSAAIVLLRHPGAMSTAIKAGLLLGAAGAVTFKLGLVAPFFGIAILLDRRPRAFLRACVCALMSMIAPALYFGWRYVADGHDAFFLTWHEVLSSVSDGIGYRWESFLSSARGAEVSVLMVIIGALAMLFGGRDHPLHRRRMIYTAAVLGFIAVYVAVNPYIYPYNFVIFLPFVAPMIIGVDSLHFPQRFHNAIAGVVLLANVAAGFWPMITLGHTVKNQERIVKWIWRAAAPDEAVFDWKGQHIWRHSVYHWWHYAGFQPQYLRGKYSLEDELRKARPTLMIDNERFKGFTRRDRRFIESHYISIDSCMWGPGWWVSRDTIARGGTFDAFLPEADYRVVRPLRVPAGILIDGQPLRERMHLRAGTHTISAVPGAKLPGAIGLAYTTPRREAAGKSPCEYRAVLALTLSKEGPKFF